MRTVFVETSFEQDSIKGQHHMIIDAIAVPIDVSEEEVDFDLELVIQKTLLESDSEWKQSTAQKVIDTKAKRGDL